MAFKEKIKADDFVMNRQTNKLFFVVIVQKSKVLLRNEETKETVEFVDQSFFNKFMFRVDPDMAKLLYEDMKKNANKEQVNESPAE